MTSSTDDFPDITSSVITDVNTIVLTGTSFEFYQTYDSETYDIAVEYIGIAADTVTVDSDTQITATFTLGVPIGSD